MKKRSSNIVSLLLITSVLASCNKSQEEQKEVGQRVFMRADSTAPYTEVTENYNQQRNGGSGMGSAFLWYMAFRTLGGGGLGYANGGLNQKSNVGTNTVKGVAYNKAIARGGFGHTAKASRSNSVGA